MVQNFVSAITPGRLGRKAETLRQKHGMRGNLLARVEILGQERRRHHERLAGVGEPFPGCPIGGKLAGRLEVNHPGQIPHGVGVFGIAEPS